MPGLAGLITKEITGKEEETLRVMLDSMLHESFYTHGIFTSKENGFFIGYSALQGSFADCMPIFNETKDIVLFLTGECYMDRSLISDLSSRGHNFNPDNASYIVHLYEENGEAFFKLLNGWYNGIILNLRNPEAILFNDRYGIRRIYFYEHKNVFAFSSEAKSLLKVFPELRKIDTQSIADFLNFDCVLENRTYFSDISLLPAGSAWSFHGNNVRKKSFLNTALLENQIPLKHDEFFEELGDTFKRILPRYFHENHQIGMSMTGGLDTRSILACIDASSGQLPCYTFGGSYRDILDVRIAPKVAAVCKQQHQVLRLDDNKLLAEYPYHAERAIYISDGLEGVDKADVISFNKLAREIAPIRMTGKYGSQVLKGIVGFQSRPPDINIINEGFRKYLDMARKKGSELQKGHNLSFLLQCVVPWWWNGFISLESSQVDVRSPFLDNDFLNVMYRAPKNIGNFGTEFELNLIAKSKPELMAIPTTGSYGGNYPWLIAKGVKTALKMMLILDKIHTREQLPYGMTHIVGRLDYLLSPLHLDRLVMGFAEFRRYRTWFRDQLSGYLQEILLDDRTLSRPYWNRQQVSRVVKDHINGRGTYLREIRKALQIELIHRVLLND
ncbi:hypothetical protein [Desulfobacterium sp. N47]|uniref:asparagine synthase (glutamine-hydrolyzing) n=1 Tax=uncultured Desulfobacterium sp. TaxID=201089 RepID=E1YJK8_9BACT|nr:hypothetical protein N47_E49740 [uncultured Desulfobacterium sp.]